MRIQSEYVYTERENHIKTEENTMKKIAAFENAIANQVKDIRAEGINATAFWAYRRSEDAGNDLIDFSARIARNTQIYIQNAFGVYIFALLGLYSK